MFYLCRYNSRHFHSLICGIVEVWGSQSCRFCDFGKIALREKKAKWNQTVEFARTGGTRPPNWEIWGIEDHWRHDSGICHQKGVRDASEG